MRSARNNARQNHRARKTLRKVDGAEGFFFGLKVANFVEDYISKKEVQSGNPEIIFNEDDNKLLVDYSRLMSNLEDKNELLVFWKNTVKKNDTVTLSDATYNDPRYNNDIVDISGSYTFLNFDPSGIITLEKISLDNPSDLFYNYMSHYFLKTIKWTADSSTTTKKIAVNQIINILPKNSNSFAYILGDIRGGDVIHIQPDEDEVQIFTIKNYSTTEEIEIFEVEEPVSTITKDLFGVPVHISLYRREEEQRGGPVTPDNCIDKETYDDCFGCEEKKHDECQKDCRKGNPKPDADDIRECKKQCKCDEGKGKLKCWEKHHDLVNDQDKNCCAARQICDLIEINCGGVLDPLYRAHCNLQGEDKCVKCSKSSRPVIESYSNASDTRPLGEDRSMGEIVEGNYNPPVPSPINRPINRTINRTSMINNTATRQARRELNVAGGIRLRSTVKNEIQSKKDSWIRSGRPTIIVDVVYSKKRGKLVYNLRGSGIISEEAPQRLALRPGTYKFKTTSKNLQHHPLIFSKIEDGSHYDTSSVLGTERVTKSNKSIGGPGAYTYLTIHPNDNILYYQCNHHKEMGNIISIIKNKTPDQDDNYTYPTPLTLQSIIGQAHLNWFLWFYAWFMNPVNQGDPTNPNIIDWSGYPIFVNSSWNILGTIIENQWNQDGLNIILDRWGEDTMPPLVNLPSEFNMLVGRQTSQTPLSSPSAPTPSAPTPSAPTRTNNEDYTPPTSSGNDNQSTMGGGY